MSVSSEISIEQLTINTIRTLSMDAVQAANSGHPGTPMALAPVAYTLWQNFMRFDPDQPHWPGRDRFVLSCGHASMLLYSVLHLAGVKQFTHDNKPTNELACSIEQIKRFRQLHSRCPGHPEAFETTGVETTTGPLGQGCGNSVGMAIAQRWLAAHFDRPGFKMFDYNVYVICSDGDMMEGISNEAASIAGHLKLSNLCWIYDDNHITIEGNTKLAFDEDVGRRFEGLGWHVLHIADANDLDAIKAAIKSFQETDDRPTMIIVRSHIGYGSPNKQDSAKAHGEALGEEEVRLTKKVYGWPEDAHFLVPEEAREHFQSGVVARGKKLHEQWQADWKQYAAKFPDLAKQWELMDNRDLSTGWDAELKPIPTDPKGVASRISSGKAEAVVAKTVPWLIGGAADLSPSTMTHLADESDFEADNYGGRNFHFGIREHAMASAANGMALSKIRPFVATFYVFFDYCKPSVRLSAIGKLPVIYIFTHDSIGLGEDGPTHQPIEHLAAMRAIPNIYVFRPSDANEVVETWRTVMPLKDKPAALVLTRQNLPTIDRSKYAPASGVAKGAYVLADPPKGGKPAVILMATGSEVGPCIQAYEQLTKDGIAARVVSMPCWALFEAQDEAYRNSVLPPEVTARVGVEAAAQFGWDRYIGPSGRFIGMTGYGASAPGAVLMKYFGFTAENIASTAKDALAGKR
jgi:transketolase